MILGIGFIMVAAMFPVAIKQTAEALEESTVATMAQQAGFIMDRVGNDINSVMPTTNGTVVAIGTASSGINDNFDGYLSPSFYETAGLNMRYSTNPQYAWVPMYSRQAISPANGFLSKIAQVTLIGCSDRNTNSFADNALPGVTYTGPIITGITAGNGIPPLDLISINTGSIQMPPNLQGRQLIAIFGQGGASGSPDFITFTGPDSATYNGGNPFVSNCPYSNTTEAAAAMFAPAVGSYVIVVDDSSLANVDTYVTPNRTISCDGYIYRIGAANGGANVWNLSTGNDMKSARYTPIPFNPNKTKAGLPPGSVRVMVVGSGVGNSASSGNDLLFQGPAMDVCAFATFTKAQ